VVLFALAALSANALVSYKGQLVIKLFIQPNHPWFNEILSLNDVWHMDLSEGSITLRVYARENLGKFDDQRMKYEILIDDLEKFMAENNRVKSKTHNDDVDEWFEEFHEYDDIISWYMNMTNTFSTIASYAGVIGTTHENRQMHGFVLSGTRSDHSKKLFFQAGLHAREWASPATVAYLFDKLVRGYNTDANATFLLDTFDIAFIPVTNPDGYSFTWTNDRLWRKNRSRPPTGSNCYGTDLNRNWDSQGYGEGYGSSSNPCSDTYHGTRAFSEPETAASSNWFNRLGAMTVVGAIDFHAYGRYVLRPYGWPITATNREAELQEIGDATADAIEQVYNTRWTSQRSAQLYPAAGGTEDWMFDSTNSNCFAYCFELRGNSFMLPPEEIVLSGEEIWAGIKVWAEMINELD